MPPAAAPPLAVASSELPPAGPGAIAALGDAPSAPAAATATVPAAAGVAVTDVEQALERLLLAELRRHGIEVG
jgi:hypothetical protein